MKLKKTIETKKVFESLIFINLKNNLGFEDKIANKTVHRKSQKSLAYLTEKGKFNIGYFYVKYC